MKRLVLVSSILVMFLIPALLAAETDKFVTAKAAPATEDGLVVPVEVTNTHDLTAMDIPLGFSEGAYLDKVTFTDRVETFEFKFANIDNEKRQVVIGLISMVTGERPDMPAGSGAVAELHFKLDPGVTSVEINPIRLEEPNHQLTYYYNDYSNGGAIVKSVQPEVTAGQVFYTGRSAIPTEYALFQNSPNPFNPQTVVRYDLPTASNVRVSVYNVIGQRVIDLVNQYQEAGSYNVVWSGTDDNGNSVASGMYFYRIKTDQFSDTKKMVLLK